MKKHVVKKAAIMVVLVFTGIAATYAQDSIPEWFTNLPVKKGFVFGAGVGKSTDLPMANDKARMNALTNLTYNYNQKFETFAFSCDSVLGPDNQIHEIITSFKIKQQAMLKGVEMDKKSVDNSNDQTIVYILLKLDIRDEVKALQKEADANATLRKKMDKSGLLMKLKGF